MSCFGCLGRVPREPDKKPLIIDVQKVIADSAWDSFIRGFVKWRRPFLKREKFSIEVPMNFYHFEQKGQEKFKTRKQPHEDVSADAEPASSPSKSGLQGKQLAHHDQTCPEHIVLETVFKNDTNQAQTYNFKFDKTRKATMSVSYQKGYSIGGSANFSLGLPKVMSDSSLGLAMNMRVQVTKSTGETFEESITTSASSQIVIDKNSHYTAKVVMGEVSLLAEFELNMIMSMPAKRAPVYIRDKASGDLLSTYIINHLLELFEKFPDVRRVKDESGKVRFDAVEFRIEGVVDGIQLASHVISLTGRSLDGEGKAAATEEEERDGGERSA